MRNAMLVIYPSINNERVFSVLPPQIILQSNEIQLTCSRPVCIGFFSFDHSLAVF